MSRARFRAYPNAGTITIAAGDRYPINVTGNFINVKSADADFTIRIDGQEELRAAANRRFSLTEEDAFKFVEVINDSGGALTFQLEIGFGRVESDDVTITGTVNVAAVSPVEIKNETGGSITVYNADINNIKTSNIAIRNAIELYAESVRESSAARALQNLAPKTDLEGASYANISNATTTVVTAAANTDGVIIRLAATTVDGAGTGYITAGGNYIAYAAGGNTENLTRIENYIIPAGQAIIAHSSNVGSQTIIHYEVL